MGASMNDEPLSFNSSHDRRYSKHVHDNVNGNIYLDPLSLKFIDTEQFQRLRDLKQLEPVAAVISSYCEKFTQIATILKVYHTWCTQELYILGLIIHSEFIGWLEKLSIQLELTRAWTLVLIALIYTVKLAGLLHDVGHGPFSHLFEREFLPRLLHGIKWSHEDMSVEMIDYIVDEHHTEIDSEILKRVKEMIIASHASHKSTKEKQFLYDIVANGQNGIDVDKLIETMRVMDDEISYRANDYLTVHKLFATCADLHQTVYTHAKVKLDDSIMKTILADPGQELKKARDLILHIRRRDLYQDMLEHFKDVTPQDIVCSQKADGITIKEDVAVSNVRIDLTRGRNNPLESIYFFQDYDCTEKITIEEDKISHLLPASCQDMIVRAYSKKPELVAAVSEAFLNFQVKTYGKEAQVHATPEKKKRRR